MSVALQNVCAILEQNDHKIENIDASGKDFTDENILGLATSLEYNSTLTSLELTGNRIGLPGVKKLFDTLRFFTILHALYLNWNSIGTEDQVFEDYVELFKFLSETFLITLDLSYTNIGQIGIRALIEALPASNITTLYIAGNGVNDEQKVSIREILDINRIKYAEQRWTPQKHLSFTYIEQDWHSIMITSFLCQSSFPYKLPLHIWVDIFSFWKLKNLDLPTDDDDLSDVEEDFEDEDEDDENVDEDEDEEEDEDDEDEDAADDE